MLETLGPSIAYLEDDVLHISVMFAGYPCAKRVTPHGIREHEDLCGARER